MCYYTRFTSFILLGLFCVLGCTKKEHPKLYTQPSDMTVTAETELGYLNVYYFSLRTCVKCHQDRVSPDLSTYEGLKENIDEVSGEIKEDHMPPLEDGYAPLTACQKAVLNKWIEAGLPKIAGPNLGSSPNACY